MSDFTPQEIEILKRMVRERQKKGAIPTRVLFDRSHTMMKTIRLPVRMVRDSKKKEPNFNRMMEFLLWDFLGRDPKYLAKVEGPDQEDDAEDDE